MTQSTGKERRKERRSTGWLVLLLLLPVMCGVMFLAARFGAQGTADGVVDRRATPFETADYRPWNEIIFAPVDDALLTEVAAGNNGEVINYDGIATARPTIERRSPVGVPQIIAQLPTRVPVNAIISGEQSPTESVAIAQAFTGQPTDEPTDAPQVLPSETSTPVASDTPAPTSTPRPTNTPRSTSTPIPPTATPLPAPSINFGADPQSGAAPLTVNFINLSSGDITGYSWNFGDGTTSTAQSPTHTFTAPGSYYVRFDITGPGGSAAAGVTINVSDPQPPAPVPPPAQPPQQPQPPQTNNNDTDGDGIPNGTDQCPNEGDLGFGLIGNGCPVPPPDRDGDGFLDFEDTCPDQGDQGFGLQPNGCPNPAPPPPPASDRDNDGVPDGSDTCPDQGDQGFGLQPDGCPNPAPPPPPPGDQDSDGVPDSSDACPVEGDNGFGLKTDGCPMQSLEITGVWLVDAINDMDIQPLGGSVTLDINNVDLSIRVYGASDINSIVFTWDGTEMRKNMPPYVIADDSGGDILPWRYPANTYTMIISSHSAANGNGNAGPNPVTLTITIP